MRSFVICIGHQILLRWSSRGDEMGRAYGMNFGEEKCIQIFNLVAYRAYRLEDLDLRCEDDIKMDLQEIGWKIEDWAKLA